MVFGTKERLGQRNEIDGREKRVFYQAPWCRTLEAGAVPG